ncbi:GNAT family N-acetyltransferase [[Mycobacterium] nativiensis]|uniref:GNAT family N-acetyltransferase n=1 Tax=[Mycobacterium] nativiensis TaxID=2855503 RepID=A0ABU5XYL2_9MYCO|nr:GNAT family N-acetyltransferase [Mycolicibacter sp. MYC340]MEB3033069.1 GNAT family N-acetyltransferase [Mycolicibacter sp. MYC340]
MAIEVRSAHKSDLTALGATLGRAFYDDPVSVWMLPDADTRTAQLSKYFATSTRYHHLGGGGVEIARDGSTVGAAALWDPPNRWKQSKGSQLRMLPALIWSFGLHITRGRAISDLLEANHPEEPHWYLAVIGSDPSVRGGGFGKAVMRSRLDRCDAEHAPAYLESSKLENVPYYERFGFQVIGEISLPNDGPTLWRMWREPQNP